MKDIKFRYWDLTDNKMVYSESHVTLESFFAFYETAEQFGNGATLMQYTGLMDANGREIFEGDLVRGSWSDKINSMVVKFQSPSFVMMINEEKWSEFNIVGNQPYIVIGNIYETAKTAVEEN